MFRNFQRQSLSGTIKAVSIGGILILIFRANHASSVLVSMQGTGGDLFSGKEAVFRGGTSGKGTETLIFQ